MSLSRRNVLKMGAALAAAPLVGELAQGRITAGYFSTGSPELDKELGGGVRSGSVVAVAGPRGSGKTAFFTRMAKANGIVDAYAMNTGTSDMLSIMARNDGSYIGSLMLDCVEPADPGAAATAAARDAFLARWFTRTCEVVRDSGGLMAISVCHSIDGTPAWLNIPHCVISLCGSTPSIVKRV